MYVNKANSVAYKADVLINQTLTYWNIEILGMYFMKSYSYSKQEGHAKLDLCMNY